jgi:hypothetical protein
LAYQAAVKADGKRIEVQVDPDGRTLSLKL